MSVSRSGHQIPFGHSRSHVSGKRASRFAARIKDNLDRQVGRLTVEFCVKASGEEIQRLTPKQTEAFMRGIGEVLQASKLTISKPDRG